MSVTSNNFEESTDLLADAQIAAFNTAIVATNPNVQYSDVAAHGYVLVDVNRERMLAEWWETGSAHVHPPDVPEKLGASFASYHGAPGAPFTDHLVAEAVGSLLGLDQLLALTVNPGAGDRASSPIPGPTSAPSRLPWGPGRGREAE
jgi:hypothetical protein